MNWIKFNNTMEEIETFSCGTMLMLRDCSTIMLGDGQTVNHDITFYSNQFVNRVKEIKCHDFEIKKRGNVDIIRLLAEGYTCKEIACKVNMALKTVNKRVDIVKGLYGCRNIPHLISVLIKSNVI